MCCFFTVQQHVYFQIEHHFVCNKLPQVLEAIPEIGNSTTANVLCVTKYVHTGYTQESDINRFRAYCHDLTELYLFHTLQIITTLLSDIYISYMIKPVHDGPKQSNLFAIQFNETHFAVYQVVLKSDALILQQQYLICCTKKFGKKVFCSS